MMSSGITRPRTSSRLCPNVFSAAGFHSRMRLSSSIAMMQSSAVARIAAFRASLSWSPASARFRSVTSLQVPTHSRRVPFSFRTGTPRTSTSRYSPSESRRR